MGQSHDGTGFHAVLLPQAGAVSAIRRDVVGYLEGRGVSGGIVADVEQVIGELLANAVCHGRPLPTGMIDLTCMLAGDTVQVTVTDGGGGVPMAQLVNRTVAHGRGLYIVNAVAQRWGFTRDGSRTTVWAVLALT